MADWGLYENAGWGSAIVEAQLAVCGLPYRLIPAGGTADRAEVAGSARFQAKTPGLWPGIAPVMVRNVA